MLFGAASITTSYSGEIKFNIPSNTPKWLEEIILKMVAADPKDRETIHDIHRRLKFLVECVDEAIKVVPSFHR